MPPSWPLHERMIWPIRSACRPCSGSDHEPGIGHAAGDDRRRPKNRAEVALDLLGSRPRKQQHPAVAVAGLRRLVRRVELIEEWVSDERARHAAGDEPVVLERQRGKHPIDEPPHLADPPVGPGPNLRRAVEDDGNPVPLRPPGEPPVKAGKVDEHADVRPGVEKAPLGPPGEIDEAMDVEDHPQEPHHGQLGHVGHEPAALRLHAGPAEADAFEIGPPRLEGRGRATQHGGRRTVRRRRETRASGHPSKPGEGAEYSMPDPSHLGHFPARLGGVFSQTSLKSGVF